MKIIKNLFHLIRDELISVIILVISKLGYIIARIIFPIIISILIDEVYYNKNRNIFFNMLILFVILFLQIQTFFSLDLFNWKYIQNHLIIKLKKSMFYNVLRSKPYYISQNNSGDIITTINNDTAILMDIINQNIARFINSIITFIVTIIFVVKINWILAIIFILGSIITYISTTKNRVKINEISGNYRRKCGQFNGKIYEWLNYFKDLKLTMDDDKIKNIFEVNVNELINEEVIIETNNFIYRKYHEIIMMLLRIIYYFICTYLIINNSITIGIFMAIMMYYDKICASYDDIIGLFFEFSKRKVSIKKIDDILKIDREELDEGLKLTTPIEEIVYKNVDFKYNDTYKIIENINLKFDKDIIYTIVGPSGVGKSSLMYLLFGFYDLNQGEIIINNVDFKNYSLKDIRNSIAYVSQESYSFYGTVRDNLTMGNPNISDDDIWKVIDSLGLKYVIQSLHDGLDTNTSDKSFGLSGGQLQRFCVARALLKNSNIMIFDEVTSAQDNESELLILRRVQSTHKNKIIIFITHRISTVLESKEVIFFKKDKSIESGSVENLLASSNTFKELFNLKESKKEYDNITKNKSMETVR
ncbi:MAG: hypothetical protein A2Y40_06615 [Candidatus Margulisbacteria bacterium GWF2_35_9]|nr:MAG: hypothetical protein A2Y40_06615 [Candidatus Margulisbacteria bacterium GWF2_35_9]